VIGPKRSRSENGNTGHRETLMPGISYNTAFRMLGPTPRVKRPEKKANRPVKYPDEAVREVRKLEDTPTSSAEIARQLAQRWPGITANWVQQVRDGVIRANIE